MNARNPEILRTPHQRIIRNGIVGEREIAQTVPFKAVIFDLDGVIALTTEQHFTAWNWTFAYEIGVGEITRQEYDRYIDSKKREEGLLAMLVARGRTMSEKDVVEFGKIKRSYYQYLIRDTDIHVIEGTIDFIRKLKERGVKLAVASSSQDAPMILKKIGVYDLFDVVVARDTVLKEGEETVVHDMKSKPSPDIFLTACHALGVSPRDTAGVEDAGDGVKALYAGNIMSIGLDKRGNQELVDAHPYMLIGDFSGTTPEMVGQQFLQWRAQMAEV